MSIIFIVTRASGSYDDYRISNQSAFFQRSDAEAYIVDRKAEIATKEAIEAELGEVYNLFDANNPIPEAVQRYDIPKWGTGLSAAQITPEMRAERTRLENLNKDIDQANSNRYGAWMHCVLLAQQEYVKSKGYDFKVETVCFGASYSGYTWDIEELSIA